MLQFLGIILSALIAALLFRHTEFKKYLLKKRIETFSIFLEEAEPCRRNAITSAMNAILDKKNFKETDLPHIIAKTYWPIILKQFSVKLILEKDHRKDFESIMKQLSLITIGAHMCIPAKPATDSGGKFTT